MYMGTDTEKLDRGGGGKKKKGEKKKGSGGRRGGGVLYGALGGRQGGRGTEAEKKKTRRALQCSSGLQTCRVEFG